MPLAESKILNVNKTKIGSIDILSYLEFSYRKVKNYIITR